MFAEGKLFTNLDVDQDDSYRARLAVYDPSTTLATRLRALASVVPGTAHLFPAKQTTASMKAFAFGALWIFL